MRYCNYIVYLYIVSVFLVLLNAFPTTYKAIAGEESLESPVTVTEAMRDFLPGFFDVTIFVSSFAF